MTTHNNNSITDEQWNEIFHHFNQSDLTQIAFCQREAIPLHRFKYRYRRSEHFAKKHRAQQPKAHTAPRSAAPSPESHFRTVHRSDNTATTASNPSTVCIRLGDRIQMQCSASVGIEALMCLAREGLS